MPPRVRAGSVDRSGLLDVFDASVFCAVVRAPAGYGKSTLLAQWCDRDDVGLTAWFSLDESHDDPVSFWSGVTAAIERVVPGFGGSYIDLLQKPGMSLLDSVMPRLVNEVIDLPQTVTVVLDDLQTVTDPVTLDALAWMMAQLPQKLRMLIGTRVEPSLPMARLRASGHLVEIDRAELAFDRDDAEAMLRAMCPDLGDADVNVAVSKTEGWPAGMAVIGMALAGEDDPSGLLADFDGRDLTIENYLVEEVLDQASPQDRQWMRLTSVLDVLTADSCNAVAEVTDSAVRLRRLEESNTLLIRLDRNGTNYRFHHLFAECLRKRLELADPDAYRAAHRRACDWHLTHAHPEAAFHHAFHTDDTDLAADVATRFGLELLSSGRTQTLRRQLERLGETVIAEHPDLALVGAWMSGVEGSERAPVDVPYYLDLALAHAERSALGPEALRETVAWTAVLFQFASVSEACALGDRIESLDEYRTGRLIALTMANYFAGRPDQATRFARHALTSERGAPDSRLTVLEIALFKAYLANIATDEGRFDAARTLAEQAMTTMAEKNLSETAPAASVPIALGRLQARLGRHDEARELLEHGLRYAPSYSTPRIFALLELARLAIDRDDMPSALDHLDTAAAAIDAHADPGKLASDHRALVRICRTAGPARPASTGPDLTERELELLALLATDLTNREIAQRLFISHNTVKSHLRVIYRKLGVASRTDAIAVATRLGVLTGDRASPG